jgi:hypothetical protein
MKGKIMALFMILPFMILQERRDGSVDPNVRSAPIDAGEGLIEVRGSAQHVRNRTPRVADRFEGERGRESFSVESL